MLTCYTLRHSAELVRSRTMRRARHVKAKPAAQAEGKGRRAPRFSRSAGCLRHACRKYFLAASGRLQHPTNIQVRETNMATETMEAPAKTSQVRIHLKSKSEDLQIPDSGPILVSTGKPCASHAVPSVQMDKERKHTLESNTYRNPLPEQSADLSQSSAATSSPRSSTDFSRPNNLYPWNS